MRFLEKSGLLIPFFEKYRMYHMFNDMRDFLSLFG